MMDGCARKPTTPLGRSWTSRPVDRDREDDDGDGGNETNGNSRARLGGVRPRGDVARRASRARQTRVETLAEKALWMDDVGKKYSRAEETDERRDDERVD